MKKIPLLITLVLNIVVTLNGQYKIQWSHVRELNSNKRPIPNAQVIFTDAAPSSSELSGKLRLAFKDKKAGEYVFLKEVKKAGFEPVNKVEIEQIKLSDNDQLGVDIILAKIGIVETAKKTYYGISDKALKASFERERIKLRTDLQASRLTLQQFEQQFEQLQKEFDRQQKELGVLAEKFARVNFDDVSIVYREALGLFKVGKIDGAINKLESVNPTKRTADIIKEENRILQAQIEIDSQKVNLAKEKQQQIANLRLLADMYNLKFNPQKAELQYDDLLRLDSNDVKILIEAADFYQVNHKNSKALHAYHLLIRNPQAEEWQIADAQDGLGIVYTEIGDLASAKKAFEQFSELYLERVHILS